MDLKVFAVVISLIFFGSFANAEVVNFKCTYGEVGGDRTSPISHSVDMTNKSWEREADSGSSSYIFDNVVISSKSISVKGQYTDYSLLTSETHVISRVDLSYTFKFNLYSETLGGWGVPDTWVGKCKISEAPAVERAF